MEPLQSGDPAKVGDYRLLGRLGEGGMGSVFLGVTPGGRKVAVKVMRRDLARDPEFRYRFAREADAAYFVGGFYTAQVVDVDPDDTLPWIASAYIPGPSLSEVVATRGPLDPDAVVRLGAALAECLLAVHRQQFIHRDLKPSNIIMSEDGPRIIDFGVVRPVEASSLTATGMIIGSFPYMSPEHLSGKDVVPESDIFSLGAVLTYAATGHGPFDAAYQEQISSRILTHSPDLTPLTGKLREILSACLEKKPADRPALRDLLTWFAGPGETDGAGYEPTVTIPGRRALTPVAAPLTAHDADIVGLTFSPDGRFLATADEKLNLILWDTATWKPSGPPLSVPEAEGDRGLQGGVAFSPESKLITSIVYHPGPSGGSFSAGRHVAYFWQTADLQPMHILLEAAGAEPQISPDGRFVVGTSHYANQESFFWDLSEDPFKPRALAESQSDDSSYRTRPVFSPDGRFVADHGNRDIRLWNLTGGALIPVPLGTSEPGRILELAVSPGGSQIAIMCEDPNPAGSKHLLPRSVRLLDIAANGPSRERVLRKETRGGSSQPWFSPNGRLLACHVHSEVGAVWVWDSASGSPADLMTYVGGYSNGRLVFSPDSRFLAADGGSAFSIRDMVAARTIRAPRDTDRDAFRSIAFSPDSRVLASSSGTAIQIWALPDT